MASLGSKQYHGTTYCLPHLLDNAVYELPKRAKDYEIPHSSKATDDDEPFPEHPEEENLHAYTEDSERESNVYASLEDETKLYSDDQGPNYEMQVKDIYYSRP